MGTLSDLPSEILYEILNLVITSIDWPEGSVRYRPMWGDASGFPRFLYCIPKLELAERHPAMNLLLTSRRLYSETKTYLSKKPQTLDLDVAIVNNHWIWPTWRSMPVRKDGNFKRIDVHFMHCCTEDERHSQPHYWDQEYILGVGRGTDDHWSPATRYFNWQSLNPLKTLVGDENVNVSIKNTMSDFLNQPFLGETIGHPTISSTEILAFHFDTRSYGDGNRLLSESEVPVRKVHGLAHLDYKQLYPDDAERTRLFVENVQDYLQSWFQEWKELELPIRIGKIMFFVDGTIVRELDAAEYGMENM